jgi:hypothetical protein
MKRLAALGMLALAAGCARFPQNPGQTGTHRLIFEMEMDANVRTGAEAGSSGLPYVYLVALRLSTDAAPTTDGPVPVVIPGGNGFVAGNATHYVLWNPLAASEYQVFRFLDASLDSWVQVGTPLASSSALGGSRRLAFEIDLSQIPIQDSTGADIPADQIQSVQVNFLTMNNTNISGGGRIWDGLGNGQIPSEVNRWLTINPQVSRLYTNTTEGSLEPSGDAADPALDLVNWRLEVQRS